jgi:hypothetical protein
MALLLCPQIDERRRSDPVRAGRGRVAYRDDYMNSKKKKRKTARSHDGEVSQSHHQIIRIPGHVTGCGAGLVASSPSKVANWLRATTKMVKLLARVNPCSGFGEQLRKPHIYSDDDFWQLRGGHMCESVIRHWHFTFRSESF